MFETLAMFESPVQWIVVLAVVLLLFGGSRIPEMMKGLGSGMKEFKKGLREDEEPVDDKSAKTETKVDAKAEAEKKAS
jgi:sec-independent protein translocase protein TatA